MAYQDEEPFKLELVVIWRPCRRRAALPLPFCRLLEALTHVPANRKCFQNLILVIPAVLLHF